MDNAIVSKILLATDFSDSANRTQVYTEYLAAALKASVVVLHVNEHPSSMEEALTESEIQTKLRTLQDKIGEHAIPVSIQRSRGKPGDEILSAAHQNNTDIISMGTQGETHVPGMIGATAQAVTANGPCPVLTVPLPSQGATTSLFAPPGAVQLRRILAPVDFSDPSLDSLECAIQLAHCLQAELVLLHVLETTHADWDLHRMEGAAQIRDQWDARLGRLAAMMKSLGLSATYENRTGFPPDSILAGALQHQCDLIVMGTHGRRGRERMNIGSVAEAVLKQAICPVLTVKNLKFAPAVRPAIRTVLSKNSENAMGNGLQNRHSTHKGPTCLITRP